MQIFYIDPLSEAWGRMKKALFGPFDIRKWFVIGFTAFLTGLTNGMPGGGGLRFWRGKTKISDIEAFPQRILDWLRAHPVWLTAILAAVVLAFLIMLLLTWLSSRGSFMFLDNVVRDRALVVDPWYQFRAMGNSLFLWRLGFGLVCFAVMLPLAVITFLSFLPAVRDRTVPENLPEILGIAGLWFVVTLVVGYISLFTNNFVVPLMYKYRIKVLAAWQKFIPILMSHLLYFLLYGIFLLVLAIGVGISIVLAGLLTCCVGFVLLALPYVGTVVLLPIAFVYRAFSLEFLAQWGPEYSVFAGQDNSENGASPVSAAPIPER